MLFSLPSITRSSLLSGSAIIVISCIHCILLCTLRIASAGGHWYQWDNSCYAFFYPSKLSWGNAVARCRSIRTSADLVFIESEQENREVSRLALEVSGQQPARWWIGLNDIDEESKYRANTFAWKRQPLQPHFGTSLYVLNPSLFPAQVFLMMFQNINIETNKL
ncbi:hypothetical protein HOLleu_45013 [Holothuria leucospilota]|uniref:C-type lectin domain-containing protein n=1 Tax=Holothuria leucospilota TaxID=206669 RepID=A0A9Q0YBW4_HOLLE|nr:hypothetical protein HOLleu_45013 [Holothuria leucospilota]